MSGKEKTARFTKLERSWITYDWANSVFATIMVAAVFPAYFTSVAAGANQDGDMWWGLGTSIATFAMAVMAPLVGAVADYKGWRKKIFVGFLVLGLAFTLLSALVNDWRMLLVGYGLSYIGFLGSCLLYDSFITDVTTPERMDMVSSMGYGMGYIGGSTIPFILSILIIMFGENFGIGSALAVKISLVIAVLWWGGFSIPMLRNVKQINYTEIPPQNLASDSLRRLGNTFMSILRNKGILLFILAYFFYIDGVNTVINMATAYGASLGLDTTGMILALLVTQLVAFPCSILFGVLSRRISTIRLLLGAVGVYVLICILGFVMGFGIEQTFLNTSQALVIFWGLAVLVGTCQGGIQALSRSYFGKLVPPERSSEYFGFFDIFGKFAAILGPGLYAGIKAWTGRSSLAILAIVLLFIIGGTILMFGGRTMERQKHKL